MNNDHRLIKIIGVLLALVPCFCFGQMNRSNTARNDTANRDVVARLKAYSSSHLTEKAYLQFDKPYYAIGDTMYFKAYVTMGEQHQLSQWSGVLHVDLVDEQNNLSQSIKLKLNNGVAWGDFALLDTLSKGNYQVRAYTAWMENDPGSFFSQYIQVGSVQSTKVPEGGIQHPKSNKVIDIQFMPESGNLVAGVRSKVAFKAVGKGGLGIDVKGIVIDNDNKQVAEFASLHMGMGYFYLEPQTGKSYKVKISYDGGNEVTELPRPAEQGIVLEINNDSVSVASLKIKASDGYFRANENRPYKLLVYSAGIATTVNFSLDSMVTSMDIVKRKLFTGVVRLTLFSADNEPLSERLIFVQNYDQLNMDLQSDKQKYNKRDKVVINLGVRNRADEASMGHFSISVIDETKVQQDEDDAHTILSDLLLISDLKGYIEKPNYYFNNINDSKLKELDLVMLTHGYRKFEWKKLVSGAYGRYWYQRETSLQISGSATMLGGRRIKNGTVALFSSQNGLLATQKIDDKGSFVFNNLPSEDTGKLILQAQNFRGNNVTTLTYYGEYPITATKINPEKETVSAQDITAFIENEKLLQDVLPLKGKTLKEVKIKAYKPDNNYETSSFAGAGNADQVMHADEISQVSGLLMYSLWGRLRGVTFVSAGLGFVPKLVSGYGPMLVIFDGMEDANINTITSDEVATVEVLQFASAAIYGMRGGNGVLIITSKHMDPRYIKAVGVLPITLNGFYKAREFYAPRYDASYTENEHRDLRSTIYWKPELTTDKDGKAIFDYFNADGVGKYKVIVEGIDSNGNLGRKVLSYQVE
jgi:hypothetical protein